MKKFTGTGLAMIMILVIAFSNTGVALAETWNVLISSHKFVVNGEPVSANALNINGNNYIKVAEFAELLNIDVSFDESTGTVSFDKSKEFSEVRKEKETKGSSVPISIASIDAGKVVCIGSITINSEYDLIYDVTAEKGNGLFVALSKEEKILSFTGKQWTMYVGNGSTENKVQGINTIPPNLNGTYYLYVGSTDDTLTNIRGTVTQSPKGTVTQYSNSSNKIIDEKNVTVNTSEKSSQKNNDTLKTSLTEVFKLERRFQGAGYFMEGPSFTIQDDITIDVSVSMTADVGELRFYIKSENGDIIYDVSGDIVSETSSVFLEAGKYQALLEGSNLKGIRYSIKGYSSLNN